MKIGSQFASVAALALLGGAAPVHADKIPLSLGWTQAMPPGPDTQVKITEAYARLVARDAFFWAWPMVNVYNRRLAFAKTPQIMMAGPVPAAPLNHLGMLTDYIAPEERLVACPNQDVVYGAGSLALDLSPVVMQVPDFGDRFWVYQVVDTRTDSFVQLGKMYATTSGFYLLVGPDWRGEVPKGITKVFRSPTNTGFVAPRVFQDDTSEDKRAVQAVLTQIMMYPLSDYDGTMKSMDWSKLPKAPSQSSGEEETKWVVPDKFLDELPAVLADAPPMPGEEARYAQVLVVLAAAKNDPALKQAMTEAAADRTRNWLRHCSSSAITASSCPTIGARFPTRQRSAAIISPAPPSPSRTFSSIRRTRRNISIRTWTLPVRGSTAPTAIR